MVQVVHPPAGVAGTAAIVSHKVGRRAIGVAGYKYAVWIKIDFVVFMSHQFVRA